MFIYFGVFAPLSVGRSVAMDVLRSYDAPATSQSVRSIQPSQPAQSIGQKLAASARKGRPKDHQSEGDIRALDEVPKREAPGISDKKINSGS
jgi:hypothetical protein